MSRSSRSTCRSGAPTLPVSNPKSLLRNVLTEISRHAIVRDPAKELQEELKQEWISRLIMKEDKDKVDTVAVTQEPPIPA